MLASMRVFFALTLLACGDAPAEPDSRDVVAAEVQETFDPIAAASFAEPELDLGVPVPPAAYVTQTLRLRNDGAEPLALSSLELLPSKPVFTVVFDDRTIVATEYFWVGFDPPLVVAPMSDLPIQVAATGVVDAREVLDGTFGLVMPSGSRRFGRVAFTVHAGPAPCLEVVPELAFGVCPVHATCTRDLTLTSCGATPVTVIFDVAQHGPTAPFLIDADSASIDPGQRLVVPITFAPTLRGAWNDRVIIHTDAVPSRREVVLSGDARIQ